MKNKNKWWFYACVSQVALMMRNKVFWKGGGLSKAGCDLEFFMLN